MENTELCWMMEAADYFCPSPDWFQAQTDFDHGSSDQHQICSRSSGSGSGHNTPSPCYSITDVEKPVAKRRSRASKKTKPTKHINATAKNFKDLVQKHTGRPRPFTIFGGSLETIKGSVTLSFDQGTINYENDSNLRDSDIGQHSQYCISPVKPICTNQGQLKTQITLDNTHNQPWQCNNNASIKATASTGVMYNGNDDQVGYENSFDSSEPCTASSWADMEYLCADISDDWHFLLET